MRRRAGTLLVEHLGAVMITALMVAWIVGLHTTYALTVVPQRRAVSARYAARQALNASPQPTRQKVRVGPETWEVTTSAKQITVQLSGQATRFVFTPGRHDDD